MSKDKLICPKCKSDEVIDIVYGYPSEETLKSLHKKEIELGGCIVRNDNPTHKCVKCDYRW